MLTMSHKTLGDDKVRITLIVRTAENGDAGGGAEGEGEMREKQ